jgi:hypothetical protein
MDFLYRNPSDVKCESYNRLLESNYTRIHYDSTNDVMEMLINIQADTIVTRIQESQIKWLEDKLAMSKVY